MWCSGTFVPQSHTWRAPLGPFFLSALFASFLLRIPPCESCLPSPSPNSLARSAVRACSTSVPRRVRLGCRRRTPGSAARVQAGASAGTPRLSYPRGSAPLHPTTPPSQGSAARLAPAGARLTVDLSCGAPETPATCRTQKLDSSPNSPGSRSAAGPRRCRPRSSPHHTPARTWAASRSHTPPPPGRQRAWANSPPGLLALRGGGGARGGSRREARARGRETRERGMGKSREMRLAHLCCCCCLLYQLGVLSNWTVSGEFCRDLGLALPERAARQS